MFACLVMALHLHAPAIAIVYDRDTHVLEQIVVPTYAGELDCALKRTLAIMPGSSQIRVSISEIRRRSLAAAAPGVLGLGAASGLVGRAIEANR